MSMEFLRSFLRRLLVGKPVVASPNVGFFVRLYIFEVFSSLAPILLERFHISHTLSHISHLSHILTALLHSLNSLALLKPLMLTLCHFPRAIIRFTLSQISHTSHALSYFPRALTFDHACFLRLSRAQSQRYCLEKMLSTEVTCITDPNIVTMHSG